jgi:hypothetical protein
MKTFFFYILLASPQQSPIEQTSIEACSSFFNVVEHRERERQIRNRREMKEREREVNGDRDYAS